MDNELIALRGERDALQGRVDALEARLTPMVKAVAAYHAMMQHTALMMPCCANGGIACGRVLDLGRDMMDLMRECETNHSFFLPRR